MTIQLEPIADGLDGEHLSGAHRSRPRSNNLVINLLFVVSLIILGFAILAAAFPEVLTSKDPLRTDVGAKFQPPSANNIFGTDELGRDLYARIVHGSRTTLAAVGLAVLIAAGFGSVVGVLAGYFGRWPGEVLMRIIDMLLAVPGLLLALAIVTALGSGLVPVAVAVGVGGIPTFARITRTEVTSVRIQDYVEAASGSGSRRLSILTHHILPNAMGPALVLATLEIGTAVLSVAALSFLGFGAPPPQPEWGRLVEEGRSFMTTAWWLMAIPSAVIAAVVISINVLARRFDRSFRTNTR